MLNGSMKTYLQDFPELTHTHTQYGLFSILGDGNAKGGS